MGLIALFSIGSLFVGLLLYLPFFFWFRHRRSLGRTVGDEVHVSKATYIMVTVQILLLIAGAGAGVLAPQSWLGSLTHGSMGLVRWAICIVVVFGIVEMVLRRAGVVLQKKNAAVDAAKTAVPARSRGLLGRWKVATIHGVPMFVHGSFPLGGLLIAVYAKADLAGSIGYCLSFFALIAVHELGHFTAARSLGLKVFSIDVSGLGGRCVTQVARNVKQTFILYSAGIAAQVVLFVSTLVAFAAMGGPQSPVGRSVFITFTAVNLLVAAINLVPGRFSDGLSTDGAILWELFLHVFRGRPHPLAKQHAASPVFSRETSLLAIEGMTPPDFTVGIEMLNDDNTPMEFVIAMLERHVKLDREAAITAMVSVHNQGGLLIPLRTIEEAEEVAGSIMRDASELGHPLMCRAVAAPAR